MTDWEHTPTSGPGLPIGVGILLIVAGGSTLVSDLLVLGIPLCLTGIAVLAFGLWRVYGDR